MDFMNNPIGQAVREAAKLGTIVPAFNVPYLPMVEPVCQALTEHKALGMVQVARLELYKFESRSLAAVAEEYHKYANREYVTLHLDHIPVIDEDNLTVDWKALIAEALDLGYDSVMIDGSRLALDGNIEVTSEVVAMAHAKGVVVEAELGAVVGHESGPMPPYEELFASKKGFTDPDEARRFAQETKVDWLSVSVGTVHGAISPATKDQEKIHARIDIEQLKLLRDATGIPLVLHGGSGVPREYIDRAVATGIAKINIATDIRQPYERTLASGGSLQDAQEAVRAGVVDLVCNVYEIAGSAERLGFTR